MSKVAEQLLKITLQDIKASEKLHRSRLYPQSVFYFQQATEKAFKAWGILNEIIKEDEIKQFSHQQIKIYWKALLEQENNVKQANEFYGSLDNLKDHEVYKSLSMADFNKIIQEEKNFKAKIEQLDLLRLTDEDHEWILGHLEEVEETKVRIPKYIGSQIRANLYKTSEFVNGFNPQDAQEMIQGIEQFSNEQLVAFYSFIYNSQVRSIFVSKVFLYCSIITSSHVSQSRYPMNDVNPLEFYTNRSPLVYYLEDYLRLLKKAIQTMVKLNSGKYVPEILKTETMQCSSEE